MLEIARETDERRRRAAGVKPRLHDVQQRIAARVIASASGCWLWQGHLDRHGYGTICIDGRTSGAHRVAYAAWRGPIPVGLEIDHLCREPRCVNPEHLEPVTRLENMRRRAAA